MTSNPASHRRFEVALSNDGRNADTTTSLCSGESFHTETENETDWVLTCGNGSAVRLCDDSTAACDADLRRRIASSGGAALPAPAAAATDGLPGRNNGRGWHGLPGASATAAAADGAAAPQPGR